MTAISADASRNLPEWPVYVDDVTSIYDHDQNMIAALRARLELITSMLQEYVDQPHPLHHPERWYWQDAHYREVIAACLEPGERM